MQKVRFLCAILHLEVYFTTKPYRKANRTNNFDNNRVFEVKKICVCFKIKMYICIVIRKNNEYKIFSINNYRLY
jgi:hypothetical protein